MKLIAVHTLPVWEERDGKRRPPHPGEIRTDLPVVGWCNALEVDLAGQRRWLLLTNDAAR